MNDLQAAILGIYKDVKGILDRNGIPHYLIYGTALGAVRHNGFIPWDDDLDIAIMEEDVERFVEAMESELDKDKYFLQKPKTGAFLSHLYKVKKNGTTFIEDIYEGEDMHQGIFMDIFVMEGIQEGRVVKSVFRMLKWMYSYSEYGYYNTPFRLGKAMMRRLNVFLGNMLSVFRSPGSGTVAELHSMVMVPCDRSVFGEPRMFRFEDIDAPIPEKYDELLRLYYDDYMQPPPEEKRVPQHNKHYSTEEDWKEYYGRTGIPVPRGPDAARRITIIRSHHEDEKAKTGVGIYADSLEQGLRERGVPFDTITVGPGGRNKGVRRLWLNILRPVSKAVTTKRGGVYHAINEFMCICFPFVRGRRILTVHHYERGTDITFSGVAWKVASMIGYRMADRIIAISPQTKEDIVREMNIPEGRIETIFSSIGDRFRDLGMDRERTIGCVSTLIPRKNVSDALRAFRLFLDMEGTGDFRMVICGKGEEKDSLLRLTADLGMEDRVEFISDLTGDELVHFYNTISVLANPSMLEGLGYVTLEAQRCMAPVVYFSDARIPKEVTRFAVPSSDVEDFARNMHRLVTDDGFRSETVAKGKEYADGFGKDSVDRVLEVYSG